jgi:serine/threonine-protein kinase
VPIAAAIGSQMLQGLHAAHVATDEQGRPLSIVHRDVSPQNVLVGADGLVRVLDFGVAKAAGRRGATQVGQVKGKLAYLAPEQAFGTTTAQSDLFSAGVVLWELLTGRGLFHGETRRPSQELLSGLSVDPPSRWAKEVPAALDQIVLRALSRDPAERFASAREMALAIETAVAPAGPVVIGTWVEAMSQATLEARGAELAQLGGGTAATGAFPRAPEPTRVTATPAVQSAQGPTRSPRRALMASALLGLAALGIGAAWLVSRAQSVPAAPLKAAVAPPPVEGAAPALVAEPAEPPPEAPPAVPEAPRVERKLGERAPHKAVQVRKARCAVPYELDQNGLKHYKPECL